jgi:hypothetical protein
LPDIIGKQKIPDSSMVIEEFFITFIANKKVSDRLKPPDSNYPIPVSLRLNK